MGETISVKELNQLVAEYRERELKEFLDILNTAPTVSTVTTDYKTPSKRYNDSKKVKLQVKNRSEGFCELCEQQPPHGIGFETFFDAHHIFDENLTIEDKLDDDYKVTKERFDHPDHMAALCPNCHRVCHHADDKKTINNNLLIDIQAKNLSIKSGA